MNILTRIFILMCAVSLFPSPLFAGPLSAHLSGEFLKNSLWDDGKAEVNIYDAEEIRYGIARKSEAVHILVKESHKPDLLVKADDWREKGLLEVLKFNYVLTVPTGIYSYRQMVSVFFDKGNFHPIKMTVGSQEWCGNSFKEIVNYKKNGSFINYITYWDQEGSGVKDLGLEEGTPFYDGLPILLRAVKIKKGEKLEFPLFPGQISSKLTSLKAEKAVLVHLGETEVEIPFGKKPATGFSLTHSKGEDVFWFTKDFPHVLLQWKRHDGTEYRLRKTFRLDYWNKTSPGDEKYREGPPALD